MTEPEGIPPADWNPAEANFPDGLRSPQWLDETSRLQKECPVPYSDQFGGFYTLLRHSDVAGAARDFRRFPSGQVFVRMPSMKVSPGQLNPPEHTAYRRLLSTYFSRDRIESLEPQIEQFVDEALTPMVERGHGDGAREFAQIVPARGLAALMNLGDDAYHDLVGHFATFDAMGWDPDHINQVIFTVFSEHIARLVAERRQSPLDGDLDMLSGAMAMEKDGRLLTDEEVIEFGVSMIGAGHSTTADSLSSIVYRLATDPYTQTKLRNDISLVPAAIEEFLRLEAPVPELGRHTAEDVEIGGRKIPAGSLVALNYGAANLDPAVFEHPEACIIERTPNKHLAFGFGPHQCAGAPLARLELKTAVIRLLTHTSNFDLDGPPSAVPGLMLKGFTSLPLRFTAP